MVRKVAFFYNVAFCDLSYNKNRNRAWKILEVPHNYFQLFVLAAGCIKLGSLSPSGGLTFPASSKFPKFSSLWFSFSSRHSCYSCSFSSFLASILTYHHRCGRTSRYGLSMGLCAIGKFCKNCQNLEAVICMDELSNFGKKNCQILDELLNSGKT